MIELEGFLGEVMQPGDDDYESARRIWNGDIDGGPRSSPAAAGRPTCWPRSALPGERELPVAIRGGGHAVAGHAVCEGGVVVDLSAMTGVRVDPLTRMPEPKAVACGVTSTTRPRPSGWR